MEIVYYIIDRFEDAIAVCENQTTSKIESISRTLIDSSAQEGDTIYWKDGKYMVSLEETQKNRNNILKLLKQNQAI